MRKIIIIFYLFLIVITISGQSKIVFCEYLLEQGVDSLCDSLQQPQKTMQWTINGLIFNPTTDGVRIYPHKKGVDTIFFSTDDMFYNYI